MPAAFYDGKSIRDTPISYVLPNYREALFPWLHAIVSGLWSGKDLASTEPATC